MNRSFWLSFANLFVSVFKSSITAGVELNFNAIFSDSLRMQRELLKYLLFRMETFFLISSKQVGFLAWLIALYSVYIKTSSSDELILEKR